MSERPDDIVERLRAVRDELHSNEVILSGTEDGNLYSRWGAAVAFALIELERLRSAHAGMVEALRKVDEFVGRMGRPAFATHGHRIRDVVRAALPPRDNQT